MNEHNIFELLCSLIRTSFSGVVQSSGVCDVDWKALMEQSIKQGVGAIVLDGLQISGIAAPKGGQWINDFEANISEDDKYEWYALSLEMEEDYTLHKKTLSDLIRTLSEKDINVLLLKGLSIAPYYPIPSHRPCGDIDIYLFDDYEKGNSIIESLNIQVDRHHKKHSTFLYNGILVENHKTFLDLKFSSVEKKTNNLISAVDYAGVWNESLGCYTMSTLTNYVFLLRHIVSHFLSSSEIITVRHLLDWGSFLNWERERLDVDKGNKLLRQVGLSRMKEIFTRLAQYVTGYDLSFVLEGEYNSINLSDVESRFMDDILSESVALPKGVIPRTVSVCRRWFSQRWKYQYLDDSFLQGITSRFLKLFREKIKALIKGETLVNGQ